MKDSATILHEEDVITRKGEDDFFSYTLRMPSTFRVEELKGELEATIVNNLSASFECSVLSHEKPGWQVGKATIKVNLAIEFEASEQKVDQVIQKDSFEELRNFSS